MGCVCKLTSLHKVAPHLEKKTVLHSNPDVFIKGAMPDFLIFLIFFFFFFFFFFQFL